MTLFPDESEAWRARIVFGAKLATREELAALLEAGRAAKPPHYDEDVAGMAQRYRGDQRSIVDALVRQRYPNARNMPISPINWLAAFAREDAGVYIVDAERYLEDTGVELQPSEDERAAVFAKACEDIGLLQHMPELERRALTGVKAAVVEVAWRRVGDDDPGAPVMHMYWPSDVIVLCHPSAPGDERAIMVCALRQTPTSAPMGEDKKRVETWAVWSRNAVDNDDGSVKSWGPWTYVRISTDGKHATLPREYPGKRLPVAFLRTEQADGGFWPCPERDTIHQVDELNAMRSNELHTVNLQGHGQVVYAGNSEESADLAIGPDKAMKVGKDESVTVLDFNPKLDAMLESRSVSLKETALSRANSGDAYSPTKSAEVSGVSRAIANLPHDKRVRELRPIFRRFEEKQLLPILVEVVDLFSDDSYGPVIGGEVTPRVRFGHPPDFEELDQKQRRLELDLKMGVISKARYAVMMGHYDNLPAARRAGLPDVLAPIETPTPSTAGTPDVKPEPPAAEKPAPEPQTEA